MYGGSVGKKRNGNEEEILGFVRVRGFIAENLFGFVYFLG